MHLSELLTKELGFIAGGYHGKAHVRRRKKEGRESGVVREGFKEEEHLTCDFNDNKGQPRQRE